jgi:hypothetical protein
MTIIGKGDIILKKKSKKKAVVRFIASILIIVLAGVASYYGSKAAFMYKFKKDKEQAEKEEMEEQASTIVQNHITVVRIGKLTALRIFNTENTKLSFVLMRPDSDLFTYDEEGNGEDIEKVVNNIQNAYGITVNAYEDFDQTAFSNLINQSESFECNLPNAVAFKDNNKMTVHLEAGEHILNGNQAWGVVSGEGEYDSQAAYMENVKAVLEGFLTVNFNQTEDSVLEKYFNLVFDCCESDIKAEDVTNYIPYYAKVTTDDLVITEFEGKESKNTFEVDIDKAKSLISEITEGTYTQEKATTEKASTTEKTETTTESENVSSKGKTIYIRNAAYVNGLATKWKTELSNDGFTIGSVDNYSKTYNTTIIRVLKDGMGQDLKKKYFKSAKIKVGNVESGADICIYIGKDANTL